MFDAINPNDRILRSRFDHEQVVGFQMSLPSGILCIKRWKFTGLFVVMSKREVITCRRSECVALTCSKLPERVSQGGFPVGKQEKLALHGSHSVARWKNSSCCTSNIIPRWPGMDAAISVPRLLPPTRSLLLCRLPTPLTTCLRARPMSISPMPSVNCSMEASSLRKLGWNKTNAASGIEPKQKRLDKWQNSRQGFIG